MAASVFGTTISEQTLRATGEYTEPITQENLADYAMKMINDGVRDIEALNFVNELKNRAGYGISAKCLIYNATGTTLNFVTYNDWHGHIFDRPHPLVIQNGQWGAFLHVHPGGPIVAAFTSGSAGAVVYRSKDPSSSSLCDWLFSWSIPYVGDNRVYSEISEVTEIGEGYWDDIFYKKLEISGRNSIGNRQGYVSNADIGEGTTVDVCAVFQLPK